jgi:DNA-binding NarL/FixJ family response regulator
VSIDSSARPTVGRERELQQIEAALDALAGDASSCLVIEGEPGIGKTRLLAELSRRAEDRGHLVLSGAAAEFERDLPFSVWSDALDAYVASQELDFSLRAPPTESVAEERYRTHRAVRALLEQLAGDRPLVLVLDDLHWSDAASIELIAALLRRGPDAPVLLGLAFRPWQAPKQLTAALAAPSVRRISLRELSEADAAELLPDLAAPEVAALYRHGGGNPFYLEQLARSDRQLDPGGAQPGEAGVPAAVEASLAEEVASLSAQERVLLQAAAVAGEPFEPDLAAGVAGLAPAEALAALDALLALDLVRSTSVPRRFVFRHPLVRRAVYESAPGGWRLAAHARAADALVARGAPPGELAHHVEQCAVQGDEQAIARLTEAGRDAAPLAPRSALRWHAAALRLLPAADRARRVELLWEQFSAHRALGELERAREVLLEVIELEPGPGPMIGCAAIEHWLGRHDEAHRRLQRAWDELPDRSSVVGAVLQLEMCVDGLYTMDFERSPEIGRAALETAREVGDPVVLAAAASALCLVEATAGLVEPAREHRDEAARLIDDLTDAQLAPRLDSVFHLCWAENYLEHYDAAIGHADRGLAVARSSGEGRRFVPLLMTKGYPLEMQGRVAEAIEVAEDAVEASRLSASTHELFWALFELAFARYYAGDLQGASAAGQESRRVGGRLAGGTIPAGGGGPGWILAMVHFEAGELDVAYELMCELGPFDLPHKVPVEKCFDWEILTRLEVARGRIEEAEGFARRAEEHASDLGLMLPLCLARCARAVVQLATGEHTAAAASAAEGAQAAEAIGAVVYVAQAAALRGRALATGGERSDAIAALRQAEAAFDRFGTVRWRDEMRRELRRLGARAEVRGPATGAESGVAALTKRELEIAVLVTDRKTNREIAGELFLSDKTVESHLRNIFVKLGVSSRVEVARAVERAREQT